MILYHGSNLTVSKPRLLDNQRALDFGTGFYLTSSSEQAGKWARSVTKRRREGNPTLNVFAYDKDADSKLKVKVFHKPDSEWLDFVVANRKGEIAVTEYDIIIGPVANDSTIPVINAYIDGFIPKDLAIERLLPQKLTDQYVFASEIALTYLQFKEAKMV